MPWVWHHEGWKACRAEMLWLECRVHTQPDLMILNEYQLLGMNAIEIWLHKCTIVAVLSLNAMNLTGGRMHKSVVRLKKMNRVLGHQSLVVIILCLPDDFILILNHLAAGIILPGSTLARFLCKALRVSWEWSMCITYLFSFQMSWRDMYLGLTMSCQTCWHHALRWYHSVSWLFHHGNMYRL